MAIYFWIAIGSAFGGIALLVLNAFRQRAWVFRRWPDCAHGWGGGYTTFSSFSLQALNCSTTARLLGGGDIVGSVVLCLLAVWAGQLLGTSINALKWI